MRYLDVLLARSEALNELKGPNEESITLINRVRTRAGVPLYTVGFSKDGFRNAIMNERLWKFFTECFRREHLIRQCKFINNALARGKAVKDFHVLFPIPQSEIDVSQIEENKDY